MYVGVAPVESPAIRHIHQAHRTTRVSLPRGAHRLRPPVGKRQFLAMAACAGAGSIHRHPLVVEKVAPQPYLLRRQRIVGRNRRWRKSPGQHQPAPPPPPPPAMLPAPASSHPSTELWGGRGALWASPRGSPWTRLLPASSQSSTVDPHHVRQHAVHSSKD